MTKQELIILITKFVAEIDAWNEQNEIDCFNTNPALIPVQKEKSLEEFAKWLAPTPKGDKNERVD